MALNLERIRENLQKAKEEADKRNAKYFQFKDGRKRDPDPRAVG